jgi:RimJ/RimL family protein N-acetyltransferase
MNLHGEKVVLGSIEKEDLTILKKWSNDPEIQYWLGGWHFPINMEDQLNWFNALDVSSVNQRFAIRTPELGIIGTANLVEIDWKNRNAFHGMMLGDKNIRNKGYGLDTVLTIMQYAFEELGLNRLDGSMIEYNKASLKLYINKCGWKKEGVQKNWYYRKGKYWDRILVGITKHDYELIK